MPKKRHDYPTFSNGTEGMEWIGRNCDLCIKAEHPIVKCKLLIGYANKGRCKVNKEILDSMLTGGVSKRVHRIINSPSCPYIKTDWPGRRKNDKDKEYPKLFEE